GPGTATRTGPAPAGGPATGEKRQRPQRRTARRRPGQPQEAPANAAVPRPGRPPTDHPRSGPEPAAPPRPSRPSAAARDGRRSRGPRPLPQERPRSRRSLLSSFGRRAGPRLRATDPGRTGRVRGDVAVKPDPAGQVQNPVETVHRDPHPEPSGPGNPSVVL